MHSKMLSEKWWPLCSTLNVWRCKQLVTIHHIFIVHVGSSNYKSHICVSEIIIIGSDNGLSPGRRQAIIWTNAGILLIGLLGINFSEILIEINTFSFNDMHLKMASAKWRLFLLGLNVLRPCYCNYLASIISNMLSMLIYQGLYYTQIINMVGFHLIKHPFLLLTYWGQDKMDAIFHTTFFNAFSWMEKVQIWNNISLNFVP